MSDSIKNHIQKSFTLLAGNLSPQEARVKLDQNEFGIILDQQHEPVALITVGELEQAENQNVPTLLDQKSELRPTIILDSETTVKDLAEAPAIKLLRLGAHGAVVVTRREVVGILPVETVNKILGTGKFEPSGRVMGTTRGIFDGSFGGSPTTPRAKIICGECGFVNTVDFIDLNNLPVCQNPAEPRHQLKFSVQE